MRARHAQPGPPARGAGCHSPDAAKQKAWTGSPSCPEQACGPSANTPEARGTSPAPGGDGGGGPPGEPEDAWLFMPTTLGHEARHATPSSQRCRRPRRRPMRRLTQSRGPSTLTPASRAPPLPLGGRGWGWGSARGTRGRPSSAAPALAQRAERHTFHAAMKGVQVASPGHARRDPAALSHSHQKPRATPLPLVGRGWGRGATERRSGDRSPTTPDPRRALRYVPHSMRLWR